MQIYGACKQCGSAMAVLDMLLERYDLICPRCGIRQVVSHMIVAPAPCYQ